MGGTTTFCSITYRILTPLLLALLLWLSTPRSAWAIIVGGQPVAADEPTWVVGVAEAQIADGFNAQFCGGSLISPQWVLTAAHCTYDLDKVAYAPAALDIMVGRQQLTSATGERIPVDHIVRHPQFNQITYANDLALLHLSRPATGAITLLPISPDPAWATPPQLARIAGWGVTASGEGADQLQVATVPLVEGRTCQTAYAALRITLPANTLCAGYASGGVDTCTGDSGGPLVIQSAASPEWVQVGVVSWGIGCAQPGHYGVYTAVSPFLPWIAATAGLDSAQP